MISVNSLITARSYKEQADTQEQEKDTANTTQYNQSMTQYKPAQYDNGGSEDESQFSMNLIVTEETNHQGMNEKDNEEMDEQKIENAKTNNNEGITEIDQQEKEVLYTTENKECTENDKVNNMYKDQPEEFPSIDDTSDNDEYK